MFEVCIGNGLLKATIPVIMPKPNRTSFLWMLCWEVLVKKAVAHLTIRLIEFTLVLSRVNNLLVPKYHGQVILKLVSQNLLDFVVVEAKNIVDEAVDINVAINLFVKFAFKLFL